MVLENQVELGMIGMLVLLAHSVVVERVGCLGDGAKERPRVFNGELLRILGAFRD